MKNSGIEWIGDIPDSWECCRIKYLFSFVKGKLPSTTNQEGKGLPYIGASEMNGKPTKLYTEDEGLPICKQEDFLILWDGANAGLVATGLTGVVSSTVVKCSLMSNKYSQKYIYYLLKYAETYFRDKVNGTTIPHMNMGYINDIPYFNIGLDVQQKIAQYLDEKCGKIDELIANQQGQIEKLKEYKQSVITEAVTKGLDKSAPLKDSGIEWIGEIPAHWGITRIKNLFELRNERNDEADLSKVNLISLYTDLGVVQHSDIVETSGNRAVTAEGYKFVYKNDIVVNIILCWMGAVGMSNYDGVTSPAYDIYQPKNGTLSEYYHYLFRTKRFNGECYRYGRGIMLMRWRTYSAEFTAINIPEPPKQEQIEILSYLKEKSEKIDRLIAIKQEKIEKLQEYKKSLIYEYVTGKKEVV